MGRRVLLLCAPLRTAVATRPPPAPRPADVRRSPPSHPSPDSAEKMGHTRVGNAHALHLGLAMCVRCRCVAHHHHHHVRRWNAERGRRAHVQLRPVRIRLRQCSRGVEGKPLWWWRAPYCAVTRHLCPQRRRVRLRDTVRHLHALIRRTCRHPRGADGRAPSDHAWSGGRPHEVRRGNCLHCLTPRYQACDL